VVVYSLGERNYSENMDAVWSVLTGPQFKAIQWLYGYYHGKEQPTRSGSTITLPGGAKIEFRSILSESRGANDAMAGGRPDLIVFDDIIPTEAAWSQTMRTRIEDRILTMIQPMGGPNCIMRGAGTQIHLDDFVSKCARGIVSGWDTTPLDDRAAIRPDGTVLFPERFTIEELERIRKEYDSLGKGYLFRREYLNDVNQDESHPLSRYSLEVIAPDTSNTHTVLCVDHSQGIGLDYFVVTQLQRDVTGRTFATVRTRENEISVPERVQAVERAILLHRPERVVVEDTSESRTFIDILRQHLLNRDIKIILDTPTASSRGDKNSFILGWIEPMCKDGSLICTDERTRDILLSEMVAFSITSNSNTDDTLDTIAGGVRYLRTPQREKKELFAPTGIPQLDRERKRLRDSLAGRKPEVLSFQ
jgi:hypothetical protein